MLSTKRFLAIGIAVVSILLINEISYLYSREIDIIYAHNTGVNSKESSVFLSDQGHKSNSDDGGDSKDRLNTHQNHTSNNEHQSRTQKGKELHLESLQVVQNSSKIDSREQRIRQNKTTADTKNAPNGILLSLTRPKVMNILKKMNDGALIKRHYFVFLLKKAKKLLSSLETVYDVSIEGKDSFADKTKDTNKFTVSYIDHFALSMTCMFYQTLCT